MTRTHRSLTALGLTLALSIVTGVTGATVAAAQEMEHGRTRPASRQVTTNQVKTQDAAMQGYAGYIRA